MPDLACDREFQVRLRHAASHQSGVVSERSFEAAAIAYLETCAELVADEPEAAVIVRDLATGHEHCFRIELDTGERPLALDVSEAFIEALPAL
jgi:hypothetical protein